MGFEIERLATALGSTTQGFEIENIANQVENGSGGSDGSGSSGSEPLVVYIIPYGDQCKALSLTPDAENPVLLTPNDVFNADGTLKKPTLTVFEPYSAVDEGITFTGFFLIPVHEMSVGTAETIESPIYSIAIDEYYYQTYYQGESQPYFIRHDDYEDFPDTGK